MVGEWSTTLGGTPPSVNQPSSCNGWRDAHHGCAECVPVFICLAAVAKRSLVAIGRIHSREAWTAQAPASRCDHDHADLFGPSLGLSNTNASVPSHKYGRDDLRAFDGRAHALQAGRMTARCTTVAAASVS